MSSSRFHDPDGKRFGIPTWPWGLAPQYLRTRRQLARHGKSPGGEYEAQVLRARGGSRGPLEAYLYDVETAVPKRVPTAVQLEALQLARRQRFVQACERRGIDATDMREFIQQARADIAACRRGRDRGRTR
ncbi:RRQRL motif-containing zinc-binding protein [Nocardia amamiensis]|uniref:RRQRL motif-containing zinc-binding protein n=1 Tax=Nocardia amamiensis TaxID=404578 RepID=UPI000AC91FB0|nr:RRQRL motif-containing zinc-binding protein [Nocardia amamiensis]